MLLPHHPLVTPGEVQVHYRMAASSDCLYVAVWLRLELLRSLFGNCLANVHRIDLTTVGFSSLQWHRRSELFFPAEAIKWPELNSGNHADGFSSEVNLTRGGTSPAGYEASIGTASQSHVDLYTADPYAVPPLPHLNPGQPQPYRDDPTAYYDAYPGAIPADYHDNSRVEAIPMTQIPLGNRTRSPGPQLGFSGRTTPASAMGRQSPGPQAAYGYSR